MTLTFSPNYFRTALAQEHLPGHVRHGQGLLVRLRRHGSADPRQQARQHHAVGLVYLNEDTKVFGEFVNAEFSLSGRFAPLHR